ncbi:MAG: DUF1553 domain-containing protein [Bryobacterales bacterium]|nr:DUF1553 domain-containing protein [Bryobacterales bacterium]
MFLAWPGCADETIRFNRDIRPIFSDRCFACHGPDQANRKSALRLDLEQAAKSDLGKGRAGIVPGDPERSEVYKRIVSDKPALRMPPAYAGHAPLSERDGSLIREWIRQGARYEAHWAFLAPESPRRPATRLSGWIRNPIDAFVLARLEAAGLPPSPEADRTTLLRRVSFDLTGLPPAPDEVAAFLGDSAPDAYDKTVDRLLASLRYAERMAIRWLEAARYADTNGYQSDGVRDMWRWRDWVIDAFRTNMPFDRFTVEQIAGDLLPDATTSQIVATGFHRNHRTSAEGGIVDEEFRVEYVADRAETTSTVWLGLTLGCARCHDHKYDPFTQKEFYQLFAFFNNLPEKGFVYNFGNEEPYIKAPLPEQERKLADYDARVAGLRHELESRQPELERAQRAWERKIASGKPLDWNIGEGLVFHDPLDGPFQLNKARQFDGKDFVLGGAEVGRFNYRDPFTFAAWIKPESANGAILSRAEDYFEGQGHALYLIEGKLRLHVIFRWTDLGMRVETEEALPLGEWQHVAATYDGSMKAAGVRLYVNGKPRKLKVLFDQCIWPIDSKEPFRIGAGGGLRFTGAIDDVRVYNRALAPAEAAVLALLDPVREIAARPAAQRSAVQADKLRMCFLDRGAPKDIRLLRARLALAEAQRKLYHDQIPTVMVMAERDEPRETFLLKRGAYDAQGDKVEPGVPAVLPPLAADWPRNRLGLARWLVDRRNPLTARVAVNRFWQMLFGTGLVKTVEDFGSQGEWPVHADLLDWLAVEFMESGWDVRHILKTIVTSATYRQASAVSPALLEKDPENRLLGRGPRLRLSPEMIRDQALAVSGLLVEQTGGPSVKPYQPEGLWQELHGGKGYTPDSGEGLYRRSLYTYWKRTVAPPAMVNFDSPSREVCVVRESRTNTPLQALNLMNDVTYVEAARKLAERMMREGGASPGERMGWAYRAVLARPAQAREIEVLESAWRRFHEFYRSNRREAERYLAQGESRRDRKLDPRELAAYTGVASLLLNLDEAITKE